MIDSPEFRELYHKKFPVLDKGYVCLLDAMGSDADVCEAARTSYGKGTKSVSDDRSLIRYMFRHRHSTPFEMAEVRLLIQMPMDCHRQQIRHRTASVSEYSTRYSEAIDDKQETAPGEWRLQSGTNKQGSDGFLGDKDGEHLSEMEREFHDRAAYVYKARLDYGVAREQARKDLPLSTYTRYNWKMDLGNLLHYLGLRMDAHAQWEIRQYANIIGNEIVAKLFPACWEAFIDYQFESLTLSRLEIELFKEAFGGALSDAGFPLKSKMENSRERDEFIAKLNRLGFKT